MKSLAIGPVPRERHPEALELLADLNPEVDPDELRRRLETIGTEHPHYQLYGAFDGQQLVAVCGAWMATKLWCGRYLEIDNLVTHPQHRGNGAGTQLMEAMKRLATRHDCRILVLDSYASNTASHRLYHRLGYEIKGFHFVKELPEVLNTPSRA